jgi:hypothetical protein
MRATVIDAGVKAQINRDPRGMLLALEHRAGASEDTGDCGAVRDNAGSAESGPSAGPEDHLAEHPVTQAITPVEARQYLPQARAALAIAQSNERAQIIQTLDAATRSYLATGTAQAAPSETDLIGAYGLEEGKRRYTSLLEARSEGEGYVNYRALPTAALRRMQPDAGQVLVPDGAVSPMGSATPAQRAVTRVLRERESDPIQAALGAASHGITPLPLSDAQAAQPGLAARAAAGREVVRDYGGELKLLSNEEAPQLAALLGKLPPGDLAGWVRQMRGGVGDALGAQALLMQLSPHAPALALAARIQLREEEAGAAVPNTGWGGDGKIDAARSIYEGTTLINSGDYAAPPDARTRRAFRVSMGETYADQPGEEAMRYDATLAAYASLSARANDQTGTFDQQRWDAAVYLANVGSGTEREVGLASNIDQPHGNDEDEVLTLANNLAQEKSPEVRTVGKEGVGGAWGIAKQLAGEGATNAQINRIKNQLLFLNPELSRDVKEGQKYYVPDEATPEQDKQEVHGNLGQEHPAFPQSGREVEAGNGSSRGSKSSLRYSDSDPQPLLRTIESAQGLRRGDLDYAERDPRGAGTVKVWSSGKFGAPEVHQVQGGGVLAEKIERENLYGKLGVKAHEFMKIVRAGQEQIDSDQYQNAASSSYHAMSSPEDIQQDIRKGLPAGSTARERANREVRNHMELSWKALDKGDYQAAYRYFAFALHTMQDSTSPEHFGFKQWRDPPNMWRHPLGYAQWAKDGIAHGASEMYPPGANSNFAKATRDAMDWLLTRKIPAGDLFSRYGMDPPPEKSQLTGKDRFIERHLGRDGR